MTVRGVRNNNPGNIDRNRIKWQGMAPVQTDPRFINFVSPQYGIRAIAKVLLSYDHQYHINTVKGFIDRWAPPVENNTDAYVAAVCADCGVRPNEMIDVDEMRFMKPLVKAIIAHECAGYEYPDAVVNESLAMAGISNAPLPVPVVVVKPPPPTPLPKKVSYVTKVGAAVAGIGGAAAEYAPKVKEWAVSLKDYSSPMISHIAQTMMTVAGTLLLWSIISSQFEQWKAKKAAR